VAAGSMVASAVSLIVRHRRVGSEQRQQIKWLVYGGVVVVGTICVGGLITLWSVPINYLHIRTRSDANPIRLRDPRRPDELRRILLLGASVDKEMLQLDSPIDAPYRKG
jgi:hypothetical protein